MSGKKMHEEIEFRFSCDNFEPRDIQKLFKNNSKYDSIATTIEKYINTPHNNIQLAYDFLAYYYLFGKRDDAKFMTYCNKSINNHKSTRAMCIMGMYYELQNNRESALKYYMMGHKLNDKHSQHHIGMIYYDMDDFDNAIKYFKYAIDNGNVYSNAMIGLCNLYHHNHHNLDRLAEHYFKIALKGNHVYSYIIYGNFLYDKERYVEAIKLFTYCHDLKYVMKFDDMCVFARSYMQINDMANAVKITEAYAFDLYVEYDKYEIFKCLSNVYYKNGQYIDAILIYMYVEGKYGKFDEIGYLEAYYKMCYKDFNYLEPVKDKSVRKRLKKYGKPRMLI